MGSGRRVQLWGSGAREGSERQLAVSTKGITETLRGMEMLGGGSGEAGLGRAEDRNQDLREGHCKVAQGGAAWQVGGIPRFRDLGLPGDDRSHLCRALCPVPGSQRGPGGSVPTWLSLESRTVVCPLPSRGGGSEEEGVWEGGKGKKHLRVEQG